MANWFPFMMKRYEVLEIDDGLQPYYFYYASGDFVPVCSFNGEEARKNIYKAPQDDEWDWDEL